MLSRAHPLSVETFLEFEYKHFELEGTEDIISSNLLILRLEEI